MAESARSVLRFFAPINENRSIGGEQPLILLAIKSVPSLRDSYIETRGKGAKRGATNFFTSGWNITARFPSALILVFSRPRSLSLFSINRFSLSTFIYFTRPKKAIYVAIARSYIADFRNLFADLGIRRCRFAKIVSLFLYEFLSTSSSSFQ